MKEAIPAAIDEHREDRLVLDEVATDHQWAIQVRAPFWLHSDPLNLAWAFTRMAKEPHGHDMCGQVLTQITLVKNYVFSVFCRLENPWTWELADAVHCWSRHCFRARLSARTSRFHQHHGLCNVQQQGIVWELCYPYIWSHYRPIWAALWTHLMTIPSLILPLMMRASSMVRYSWHDGMVVFWIRSYKLLQSTTAYAFWTLAKSLFWQFPTSHVDDKSKTSGFEPTSEGLPNHSKRSFWCKGAGHYSGDFLRIPYQRTSLTCLPNSNLFGSSHYQTTFLGLWIGSGGKRSIAKRYKTKIVQRNTFDGDLGIPYKFWLHVKVCGFYRSWTLATVILAWRKLSLADRSGRVIGCSILDTTY